MLHVYDNKARVFDTRFSYLDWLKNFQSINSMKIWAQNTTVYTSSENMGTIYYIFLPWTDYRILKL